MDWFVLAMRRYAVFRGRSRRAEYWWFLAISVLVSVVLGALDGISGSADPRSGGGLLSGLFAIGTFLPALAVTVRRLHDTGRSGWWVLLALIPLLGLLALLVILALPGTRGANAHGPDPLDEVPAALAA